MSASLIKRIEPSISKKISLTALLTTKFLEDIDINHSGWVCQYTDGSRQICPFDKVDSGQNRCCVDVAKYLGLLRVDRKCN